jgi:hypothetical protein
MDRDQNKPNSSVQHTPSSESFQVYLNYDVALLSETHLKSHERFFIPNYHFYWPDCFPGREGGTAVEVRKGVPHTHVDLPPLVSIEATGVCILIGNNEVLLAAVCNSPGHAWNVADVIELLTFRHKLLLAGDLNANHPFWNSIVSPTLQFNILHEHEFNTSAPQCPTQYSSVGIGDMILLCTRMSDCQKSLSLIFWTPLTYQSFSSYWIMLELGILQT